MTAFDDKSLVELMTEKGVDAISGLPDSVKQSEEAVAETIENNVRKLITDEMPTNPRYYQRMSELLDELVKNASKLIWNIESILKRLLPYQNK